MAATEDHSTQVKKNAEGELKEKGKIESKTQKVEKEVEKTLVDGSTKDSGSSDGGEKMSGNDKNVEDNKTDKSSKVSDSEGDKNKKNIKPDSGTSEKGSLEKEKAMVETKKTENDEFKAMMKQFQEQNQARTKEKQELLQKLKEANDKIDTLTKEQKTNTNNVGAGDGAIKVNSGTNNQDSLDNMQKLLKTVNDQQEKGFFGKIGDRIKSAFSWIGNGIKKGVNGVGSGIGKVTNRFVQICQNNAAPTQFTDRRKGIDENIRKPITMVIRKVAIEPAIIPFAGIGSLLSGDGSYFQKAWERWRGKSDKSEAPEEKKDDKSEAPEEMKDDKSAEEKEKGKMVPFSSPANKATGEKSAIPPAQTKTAANTSSLTNSAEIAETKSETTPTMKTKESTEKITINKDDKFYCENGNAYYNVKKIEGDNITYIYYQDDKATEAKVTNKDNFLKMITEKKCYQKKYPNAA